jgi:urease accessory protein
MDDSLHLLSPQDMPEGARATDLPRSVRVEARIALAVSGASGATRILERREEGAYRFRMTRRAADRHARTAIEALVVNVAGGLAGGDTVEMAVAARDGATFLGSSVTAERIYRAHADTTRISLTLTATGGSDLVWLPQETILHHGARLARPMMITCDGESRVLFGDILHLGRTASGEGFTRGALSESWRIRLDGRLIFADETRLADEALAAAANPGLLGEANSLATLLIVGRDAPDRLEAVRAALGAHPEVEAGATARDGLVFARLLGKDGMALRRAYFAAMQAAAGKDRALPRLIASEFET